MKSKKIKFAAALFISGSLLFGGCSAADKPEKKEVSYENVNYNGDYVRIPIYKIAESESGVYFLDPSAEFEKEIYVDWNSINNWELQDLEQGEKIIGIFDSTSLELLGAEKIYYTSDYVLNGNNVK